MSTGKALFALLAAAILSTSALAAGSDLIEAGEAQLKAGKIGEAIATLERAAAADPGSSLAYTRLGGAQILHQEYAAGIESLKRAIALDGDNAEAFVGMAVAYIHTGRYALARAALEEAKRIDPGKRARIEELIIWIDGRMAGEGP